MQPRRESGIHPIVCAPLAAVVFVALHALVFTVAQLTSEKAVAEAYAGELKTALEEAYEYIEKLEEERYACMLYYAIAAPASASASAPAE